MSEILLEYGPAGREMKRELVFSMILLALYPVPVLWALSRILPSESGLPSYAMLGAILLVELASAAGRTAMLRAMERSSIRVDSAGVEKRIGGSAERMDFAEIAGIRVSRSFLFFGITSLRLRGARGRSMYVPAWGAGPELLGAIQGRVPAGAIKSADPWRYGFALIFSAVMCAMLTGFAAGAVPASAVLFAASFSIAVLLFRFPAHHMLGRGFRALDNVISTGLAACVVVAGATALLAGIVDSARVAGAAAAASAGGAGRPAAVFELARIGGPRALRELLRLSRSADPEARKDAAIALAGFRDREALRTLDVMLDDVDAEVRRSAAYAMGGSMRMKSVPRLVSVLSRKSEDAGVVKAVNASLERITGETLPAVLDSAWIEDHERLMAARFWQQVWNNYLRKSAVLGDEGSEGESGSGREGE